MKYPSPLSCGMTIGLVAPSSPVSQDCLTKSIHALSSLGFHVLVGNSCQQTLHGYLAGNDSTRANDINSMFSNPKVNAIFCLRGGYGSTRILRLLDYELIKHHPKIFVGYSDITAIHLALYSQSHLITFHGPMVSSNMVNDFDSYTRKSFFDAIAMPSILDFHNPDSLPWATLSEGTATGRILGGCLSLISPSIGTFYQPDFHDTILFLEDIDETVPRCDKLMQHLANSGILDQVNGVLLGNFVDCENPRDCSYTICNYFCDFFKDYKKPVLYGIQSGHAKPMGTIPLGSICTVDTNKQNIQFSYQ